MIYVANVKTYNFKDFPDNAASVYIGRAMPDRKGSPLGNPFKLTRGESREACIAKYAHWLQSLPAESAQRQELARLTDVARKGDLILLCWCAPEKCHGDVIKEMIEAELKRPQWTRPLVSEITATDGPMMSITIPATDGPVILSSVWESPQWAKCSSCNADFLRDPEDGHNCHVCLRAKAAAFDALSEQIASGAWEVLLGIDGRIVIAMVAARSSVAAPTLAEAVKAAMEAEGER